MGNLTDISSRADIALLVSQFYRKVRAHPELGAIFTAVVEDWDAHLELLTDFWETQLFLKRKYYGNPVTAHQKVDDAVHGTITPEHFGMWMNLWFQTLDELFAGETVWIAKNRAQKMSTMLFLQIYEHRNK